MRANDANETVEGFRNEGKRIHQLAISNELNTEEIDDEFEKFDGKMNSIQEAILKTIGLDNDHYEYQAPGPIPADKNVTVDSLVSELTFNKARFKKFQDNLKAEKYKMVDRMKNTSKKLNNTTKGLFTKSVTDLQELIDLFLKD